MIIEYINNEDRSSICTVYDATVVPRVGDHVWLSVEWVVRGVVITPNGFMAARVFMEEVSNSEECFC